MSGTFDTGPSDMGAERSRRGRTEARRSPPGSGDAPRRDEAAGAAFVGAIDDGSAEMFNRSLLLMAAARTGREDHPITVYVSGSGVLSGEDETPDPTMIRPPR